MIKPRVYLAGPVTNNYWRSTLANGNERIMGVSSKEDYFNGEIEFDEFIVVGPHSISCDHRCYHAQGTHAAVGDKYDCIDLGISEFDVVTACTRQIAKSDFVFAYIDSENNHGTLAEIGAAHAIGTPVYILFASEELKKDMWFINGMSIKSYVVKGILNLDEEVWLEFHDALDTNKKLDRIATYFSKQEE